MAPMALCAVYETLTYMEYSKVYDSENLILEHEPSQRLKGCSSESFDIALEMFRTPIILDRPGTQLAGVIFVWIEFTVLIL